MRNRKRHDQHDEDRSHRHAIPAAPTKRESAPSSPLSLLPPPSVVVAAALAAFVLSVYVKTLYPSVAGGDSGELVAESCHLGVSHPPGYPLFNMAVHAFTTTLWGGNNDSTTIAWRANLFSASTSRSARIWDGI